MIYLTYASESFPGEINFLKSLNPTVKKLFDNVRITILKIIVYLKICELYRIFSNIGKSSKDSPKAPILSDLICASFLERKGSQEGE